MLNDAQNSALQNTNVFCEHLATLDRTSNTGFGTDETTLRALIQYTFSSYAHLLQSKNSSYSLVMDGAYLYNISAYQPMQLLPVNERGSADPAAAKFSRTCKHARGPVTPDPLTALLANC